MRTTAFLMRHGFVQPDVHALTDALLYDMQAGLGNAEPGTPPADQPMIVSYAGIPTALPKDQSVIVIDAGGTNFRSCLARFDKNGAFSIERLQKTAMPATDRELSKAEFYDAIAERIGHLRGTADRIGFCFSYAMELNASGDGKVLCFSKEVKAPQVVGTYVAQELRAALLHRGWDGIQTVTMVNDTVASLLAATTLGTAGRRYGSYAGVILGTGLNSAYVEHDTIGKLSATGGTPPPGGTIVVCESGLFAGIAQSQADVLADGKSARPGTSRLEKMCSGAYLGAVAYELLLLACADGLFSAECAGHLAAAGGLGTPELDRFLAAPYADQSVLGRCAKTDGDRQMLTGIVRAVIERAGRIVSAVIASAVVKTGRGGDPLQPVLVEANGTTFWKTTGLHDAVRHHLREELGRRGLHYELCSVPDDITLGTAIAGVRL